MPNFATPRELLVDVEIFWDGGAYVSHCPVLSVCSQGDTVEEAESNIAEALNAFIGACRRMGTLEQVLEEAGLIGEGQRTVQKRYKHTLPIAPLYEEQESHASYASQA